MTSAMMVLRRTSVLLICCVSLSPVLAQLGDGNSEREPNLIRKPPSKHQEVYDDYDEIKEDALSRSDFNQFLNESIQDTYKGCLDDAYINGTFYYLNLTEDYLRKYNMESKADACFGICYRKDPFSFYVSLNQGLQEDNDACGCHSEEEIDLNEKEHDDSKCDTSANLRRIYCGPENKDCLNTAAHSDRQNKLLFTLLLGLAVLFIT